MEAHREYTQRLEARRALAAQEARRHALFGYGRIALFVAAAVLAWLAFASKVLAVAWLLLPAGVWVVLSYFHDRAARAVRRAERAAAFYERGLARLEHRWAGGGEPGQRFLDEHHPCAADLDLFGTGSLFELLCTARTRVGEDTLAGWLRAPATPDEVRDRQAAVAELRPLLDLREDLALLGANVRAGVDLDALARWAAAPPVLLSPAGRVAALAAAALGVVTLLAWGVLNVGPSPFLVALLLGGAVGYRLRGPAQAVLTPIERRTGDLVVLYGVLARLEREPFAAPLLRRLRAELDTEGKPPSERIAYLVYLLDWLNAQRNQLFMPLAIVLLWPIQFAYALEAWRRACGPAVARWLAAVGTFEALGSLAAYAFENPDDPFPEVVAEGPCFEGVGLGHPLLPAAQCVRNDLRLGGELRVLIVSGSNMSGKSTLLRTVGVNTVLALAGAPVRARRLRVPPLAVGATLRIQDSLAAGTSRFYAEIKRLRQLFDLARGPLPLLLLEDEILHGTNSHDRRVGAEAVVRGLVAAGAVGLVTTHDLALTEVVGQFDGRAANVHFADHFEDGAIRFDYQMQPGVVRHSNALALMRAVGLEV